jgi:hypothetical protein
MPTLVIAGRLSRKMKRKINSTPRNETDAQQNINSFTQRSRSPVTIARIVAAGDIPGPSLI